jgi:4-nitrophenyl phosphatase
MPPPSPPAAVAVDLDGVVWLGDEPIPGAAEAVRRLRGAGVDVVFVTNNAFPTLAEQEAKLARFGIDAHGDVLSSPAAAASLLQPGDRVLVAGGPGIVEAVAAVGAVPLTYAEADAPGAGPVDVVIVGFHRDFDWDRMRIASAAVRAGARFLATNDDATYPTPDGPVPGGGAILAAVATASGAAPIVAGKPHRPLAEVVRRRCGPVGVMIGDRPDTDGAFATALGWRFALVLTGVTASPHDVEPAPDLVAADLAALVDQLLGAPQTA